MTTQIQHFIDGKRTTGQSTRTADVFDPSTGRVQAKVPMAGNADIDAAVRVDWPRGIRSAAPGY